MSEQDISTSRPSTTANDASAYHSLSTVLDSLDAKGSDGIPLAESKVRDKLSASLEEFGTLIEKSSANVLLGSLGAPAESDGSADKIAD